MKEVTIYAFNKILNVPTFLREMSNRNSMNEKLRHNKTINEYYFPKKAEDLDVKRVYYLDDTKTLNERIEWAKKLISFFSSSLKMYVKLKRRYEDALFKGSYDRAVTELDRIERVCGQSVWMWSQKLFLYYQSNKKMYKKDIERVKNIYNTDTLMLLLLNFYEQMVDLDVSFEDYRQNIYEYLSSENRSQIKSYISSKVNITYMGNAEQYKIMLSTDEQISMIDYFESVVEVILCITSKYIYPGNPNIEVSQLLFDSIRSIYEDTNENRLRNVYVALGGEIDDRYYNKQFCNILEKYTAGRLELSDINKMSFDYDLYMTLLKANIDVSDSIVQYKTFWETMYSIFNADYQLEEATNIVSRYYKLFYQTTLRYKVLGILVRKLHYLEIDEVLYLSILSDKSLTPLFFQVYKTNSEQISYLEKIEKYTPNSSKVLIFAITGNRSILEGGEIDEVRTRFYQIKYLFVNGFYHDVVNSSEAFLHEYENAVNRQYYCDRVRRILFKSYIYIKDLQSAMHHYVDCLLFSRCMICRMPLETLINAILEDDQQYKSSRGDIYKVILFFEFYKTEPEKLAPIYMDFLEANHYTSIIEWMKNAIIDKRTIYFLYKVCNEELIVYDYLSCVRSNPRELRIQILKYLLEKDPHNDSYMRRLVPLIREQQLDDIRDRFNHNRIFIDRDKLIAELMVKINTEFTEFKDIAILRKQYYDKQNEHFFETNLTIESYKSLFNNIIRQVKEEYLFKSPYSLEHFLSTRIRHVFCSECLKRTFEMRRLFCKKRTDISENYDVNEFWKNKMDEQSFKKLITPLSVFSKQVDDKIKEVRDEWLHIKNADSAIGMFDYTGFENQFMDKFEIKLALFLVSEVKFFENVIRALDEQTKEILTIVRERIDNEIVPYFLNCLRELEIKIKDTDLNDKIKSEVLRAIEMAKAKYIDDINNFKDVFYMLNPSYVDFKMQDVLNLCFEIEKDVKPDFAKAKVEVYNDCNQTYQGKIYPYIVDILSILLNNAVIHSEFDDMKKLNIEIYLQSSYQRRDIFKRKQNESQLQVRMVNNLSDKVNCDELNNNITEIIKNLNAQDINEKSRGIKKSGLYKIARTIAYSLETSAIFICPAAKEDRRFDFSIILDLNEYEVKNESSMH